MWANLKRKHNQRINADPQRTGAESKVVAPQARIG